MLTTDNREYTQSELDVYSRIMASQSLSAAMVAILAVSVGGLATLITFALYWLYAWITSGTATWTLPLVVGAVITVLTALALWVGSDRKDWTKHPPESATEVNATAYAAWVTENDSLDTVFVFRVEADRYLLITENALTPSLLEEHAQHATKTPSAIPSKIQLILMGEGEFRIAMNVSLTGVAIPLAHAAATPTDADRDDETPIPDGLYTTTELPDKIRRTILPAEPPRP